VGSVPGLKADIKKMTLKGYRRPFMGKLGFNGLVILALLLMGLLAVSQATSDAEPGYVLSGPVIRVADGDTITVRVGSENHRIRLASIDAPETASGSKRPGQPYAQAMPSLTNN